MNENSKTTQIAFLAGALYFCFMAAAHFFGIKLPVLFIYYDTPFHAYQDKIISFAVLAYVALFYCASKLRAVAMPAIIVLALTVLGLASVNVSDALQLVLAEGQSTVIYWLQTVAILFYLLLLLFLYHKDGRSSLD